MSEITKKLSVTELAAVIVKKLESKGLTAAMVGGSVVSIYTNNKYMSRDIDFISPDDHRKIRNAMEELGFATQGKDFVHPNTPFTVEFPTGPIGLGDEVPVEPEGEIIFKGTRIKLYSPTQSVMDRLACFYHFNDRQCLDQAVWVYQSQNVDLERVKSWSKREGQLDKYEIFASRIKAST